MLRRTKKLRLLLVSLVMIFVSGLFLFSSYFSSIKNEVFNDVNMNFSEKYEEKNVVYEVPSFEKKDETEKKVPVKDSVPKYQKPVRKPIDYSKYYGVLEIPKINLKRGFYNIGSKYNDIKYNVSLVKGSSMPDVNRGNLILMAHSGDSRISYFRNLYKLQIGDEAYVSYNGIKYGYKIVNIYNVPKKGTVAINRNFEKNTLTLITCTKDDDKKQTVYILEMM